MKAAPSEAQKLADILQKALQLYSPKASKLELVGPYPALIPRVRGKYIWHVLAKWKPKNENDLHMEDRLSKLVPPSWDVDVRPASIL